MKFLNAALITLGFATTAALAQNAHDHSAHEHEAMAANPTEIQERVGDPWPLDTCIVAGSKLGSMGDPVIMLHEGREVRFCCQGCVGMFEADSEEYLTKADETIKEEQMRFYPLSHCINDTDEALSNEESQNTYSVIGNRLFIFCCPPCEMKVRAEPEKYFQTLDQAVIEAQTENYPLDTCVISAQPLDSMGGPINVVIANQLVKLCCPPCNAQVEADPAGTLAKIEEARKASEENRAD